MSFRFQGIGLHTGQACSVEIRLGGEGFVFRGPGGSVRAVSSAVHSTELCTTLRQEGYSVSTVEHLLAALAGLGHFDATIEVEGPEIPILDGSAAPFVEAMFEAGQTAGGTARPAPLCLLEPFEIQVGQAWLRAEPAETLSVDYSIEFPVPSIGRQRWVYRHTREAFRTQLAPARTFTLASVVDDLRRRGLIQGGSLDCALVYGPEGLLNGPQRFEDEPVRHKTLDLMGDLALLGRPLQAHLEVRRGGHGLHTALVQELHRQWAAGAAGLA